MLSFPTPVLFVLDTNTLQFQAAAYWKFLLHKKFYKKIEEFMKKESRVKETQFWRKLSTKKIRMVDVVIETLANISPTIEENTNSETILKYLSLNQKNTGIPLNCVRVLTRALCHIGIWTAEETFERGKASLYSLSVQMQTELNIKNQQPIINREQQHWWFERQCQRYIKNLGKEQHNTSYNNVIDNIIEQNDVVESIQRILLLRKNVLQLEQEIIRLAFLSAQPKFQPPSVFPLIVPGLFEQLFKNIEQYSTNLVNEVERLSVNQTMTTAAFLAEELKAEEKKLDDLKSKRDEFQKQLDDSYQIKKEIIENYLQEKRLQSVFEKFKAASSSSSDHGHRWNMQSRSGGAIQDKRDVIKHLIIFLSQYPQGCHQGAIKEELISKKIVPESSMIYLFQPLLEKMVDAKIIAVIQTPNTNIHYCLSDMFLQEVEKWHAKQLQPLLQENGKEESPSLQDEQQLEPASKRAKTDCNQGKEVYHYQTYRNIYLWDSSGEILANPIVCHRDEPQQETQTESLTEQQQNEFVNSFLNKMYK